MNAFRTLPGVPLPSIPQFEAPQRIPQRLVSTSGADEGGPTYRYGGLVTYEKPILEFFADQTIGPSLTTTLRSGAELPNNCVGIRFIDLVAGVWASINGGGLRKILNNDTLTNCEINSLVIVTDATGTVTIQAVGTGD